MIIIIDNDFEVILIKIDSWLECIEFDLIIIKVF